MIPPTNKEIIQAEWIVSNHIDTVDSITDAYALKNILVTYLQRTMRKIGDLERDKEETEKKLQIEIERKKNGFL